jgi:hypothetical protein
MANRCARCDEEITERDVQAPYDGTPLHYECGMRMALGSIAHVEKRCGCYVPGSEEGDPPGMSKRHAARLVQFAIATRVSGRQA